MPIKNPHGSNRAADTAIRTGVDAATRPRVNIGLAKMNAAKMAQVRANDDLSAARARAEALDKAEAALRARESALQESKGQHEDNVRLHNAAARELLQRQKELAANEARVADALTQAKELNDQAKSYEGHAYTRLEAVRKKLAEAEAL